MARFPPQVVPGDCRCGTLKRVFGAMFEGVCGPCLDQYQREVLTERDFVRAFDSLDVYRNASVELHHIGKNEQWVPRWAAELVSIFGLLPGLDIGVIVRFAVDDATFREGCGTIIRLETRWDYEVDESRAAVKIRALAASRGLMVSVCVRG